jgi:hypothetical protein
LWSLLKCALPDNYQNPLINGQGWELTKKACYLQDVCLLNAPRFLRVGPAKTDYLPDIPFRTVLFGTDRETCLDPLLHYDTKIMKIYCIVKKLLGNKDSSRKIKSNSFG